MLIAVQKPTEEILVSLVGKEKVFLVGCKGCARGCECAGENQVFAVRDLLQAQGKSVVGFTVLRMVCDELDTKSKLKYLRDKIALADSVLDLSCGIGAQQLAAILDKQVHPGNNTFPLGGIHAEWRQANTCLECGDCVLDYTAGICPYTGCPKNLLHGPCGGVRDGKCEVKAGSEIVCVWQQIVERQTKAGRLDQLSRIKRPKSWSLFHITGRPLQAGGERREI